jgi:hypothetical protein
VELAGGEGVEGAQAGGELLFGQAALAVATLAIELAQMTRVGAFALFGRCASSP